MHARGRRHRGARSSPPTRTIVGLIGSACSDETVGGIETLTERRPDDHLAVEHAPGADRRRSRAATYAGYLRTAHSDAFQGKAVAEFVFNELGLTKAATIHDGSALRRGAPAGLRRRVQGARRHDHRPGGRLQGPDRHEHGPDARSPRPRPSSSTSRSSSPRAASSRRRSATSRASRTSVLIGSDGLFSADFVKAAGPGAEGMYLSSPNFSAFQAGYADFLEQATRPSSATTRSSAFHAHAYDATNIAVRRASRRSPSRTPTAPLTSPQGRLRDAIFATKDFPGVTGTLSLQPDGRLRRAAHRGVPDRPRRRRRRRAGRPSSRSGRSAAATRAHLVAPDPSSRWAGRAPPGPSRLCPASCTGVRHEP